MKPILINRSCYLCNHSYLKPILQNISFGTDIIRCNHCGFIQTEYVSQMAVDSYYANYYRSDQDQFAMERFKCESAKQASSQLKYIETVIPEVRFKKALEIGAGAGEMARALYRKNILVDVTELDPKYQKLLKADDTINVIDIQTFNSPYYFNIYDLVILSHVLEHLTDPIHMLDRLSHVLKKDGHVFIELPNEVEMVTKTGWQGKGHLFFFTIETFKKMIALQGSFDILEIRTSNRSIDDFIASNYTLPDDHENLNNPNGTSIRAILINRSPKDDLSSKGHQCANSQETLDDYSHRILKMHHQILNLSGHIEKLTTKYKTSLSEASELFRKFNDTIKS